MHKLLFLLAVTISFVWLPGPSAAYGAPFCIESQGLPAECWYYDMRTCREEADKKGSLCTANPQEISFKDQSVPFCIIDPGMKPVCAFQSRDSCQQEAARRDNSVCVQNTSSQQPGERMERKTLPEIFAESEPVSLLPEERAGDDSEIFEQDFTSYMQQ